MNEAEIITALRVLAGDVADLGPSPITKASALALLASSPENAGPLVQWFNREADPRRKLVLRELIRLTVRAGYIHDAAAIAEATDRLSALVDRVDDAPADSQGDDPWVPVKLAHVIPDRSTMGRHADEPIKTGVSKAGRGNYRIRRSRLGDYLSPRWRRDYGL